MRELDRNKVLLKGFVVEDADGAPLQTVTEAYALTGPWRPHMKRVRA